MITKETLGELIDIILNANKMSTVQLALMISNLIKLCKENNELNSLINDVTDVDIANTTPSIVIQNLYKIDPSSILQNTTFQELISSDVLQDVISEKIDAISTFIVSIHKNNALNVGENLHKELKSLVPDTHKTIFGTIKAPYNGIINTLVENAKKEADLFIRFGVESGGEKDFIKSFLSPFLSFTKEFLLNKENSFSKIFHSINQIVLLQANLSNAQSLVDISQIEKNIYGEVKSLTAALANDQTIVKNFAINLSNHFNNYKQIYINAINKVAGKYVTINNEFADAIFNKKVVVALVDAYLSFVGGKKVGGFLKGMKTILSTEELRSKAFSFIYNILGILFQEFIVPGFIKRAEINDTIRNLINTTTEKAKERPREDLAIAMQEYSPENSSMLRHALKNRSFADLNFCDQSFENLDIHGFNFRNAKLGGYTNTLVENPDAKVIFNNTSIKNCNFSNVIIQGSVVFKDIEIDFTSMKSLLPSIEEAQRKGKGNNNINFHNLTYIGSETEKNELVNEFDRLGVRTTNDIKITTPKKEEWSSKIARSKRVIDVKTTMH
jgi:hypothetical protein